VFVDTKRGIKIAAVSCSAYKLFRYSKKYLEVEGKRYELFRNICKHTLLIV